MMKTDTFFLILIGVFILPALYFSLNGGPFGERIIFDYINDEYNYFKDKNINGEYLNLFWAKDPLTKVQKDLLNFKKTFRPPETNPQTGMVFLNYPEAVVVLRNITPALQKQLKITPLAKTLIYVSSPEVGTRVFNRHGHTYVYIHRHYHVRYRGRYGRYFRSHGSTWGK